MNGKYIRLTPPLELQRPDGLQYADFDPKTVYLAEGADPIIIGRASSKRGNNRMNDPDNGYLDVPTGQTALGQQHAMLCVRNNGVYISMKDHDGMINPLNDGYSQSMLLAPHSAAFLLENNSRVRLGVNGAVSLKFLVDVVFQISDTDNWVSSANKKFIRELPA
ncbi:hypothetical protein B0H10DRAFT_2201860 [Mycena sp. CBHHK59/15]|nr:hypothetical protein B0H10DRAFT_2201860 [Mycena sp. CBHHK59/15]